MITRCCTYFENYAYSWNCLDYYPAGTKTSFWRRINVTFWSRRQKTIVQRLKDVYSLTSYRRLLFGCIDGVATYFCDQMFPLWSVFYCDSDLLALWWYLTLTTHALIVLPLWIIRVHFGSILTNFKQKSL